MPLVRNLQQLYGGLGESKPCDQRLQIQTDSGSSESVCGLHRRLTDKGYVDKGYIDSGSTASFCTQFGTLTESFDALAKLASAF
ncbi:hypothetical protein K239x_42280 [Planctomycetes bacterium K23_9]|uniref:Uncharacterized protein n=1 Tax=Stieleria marina TaxID=1930275 RepID=A0A517NYL9_9BACT|nr:hypothetical protein K239x_42280 [Planctomycetes bacterium K23_9]